MLTNKKKVINDKLTMMKIETSRDIYIYIQIKVFDLEIQALDLVVFNGFAY